MDYEWLEENLQRLSSRIRTLEDKVEVLEAELKLEKVKGIVRQWDGAESRLGFINPLNWHNT